MGVYKSFFEKHSLLILFLVIPAISILMHLRVFNLDIMGQHSWRQTLTQSNIRNFYHEDFNILNPRIDERGDGDGIFRQEFPLMQWFVAAVYKITGEHIMISRSINFIIGLFTLWGFYFLLLLLFKAKWLALAGSWAFNFSPLFYYYTINPMPDNLSLCFAVWSLYFVFRFKNTKGLFDLILSAIFVSLSALSKLPFILFAAAFYSMLVYEVFFKKESFRKALMQFALYTSFLLPAFIWYLWVIPTWNNAVIAGIFHAEAFTLNMFFRILGFTLFSTLPELMINYLAVPFFLISFYYIAVRLRTYKVEFFILATSAISFVTYFFYEINAINTVHDYYLMPFLPFIFILVSYGVKQLFLSAHKHYQAIAIILLVLLPLTAYLRIDSRWNSEKPGFNKDLLQYRAELSEAIPDSVLCIVGSDPSYSIFLYYLNKKGWRFSKDTISLHYLKYCISRGASYMYSDSRKLDENPLYLPYFDSLVMQKGSIRLFSLKMPEE